MKTVLIGEATRSYWFIGEPPSAYKARDHPRLAPVPPCMTRAWARPGWIAQPCRIGEAFLANRA